MQLTAVVLLLFVAIVAARPKWHQLDGYTFDKFVRDFNRPFRKGSPEYKHREGVFNRRLRTIREHNKDLSHSWKRGVNMFSDMTEDEFKALNRFSKSENRPVPAKIHSAPADWQAPVEVDYRTWTSPRVLTAVKHQGSCGSCWAFSATESMEAHYALLTGMLPVLSPQQITSCTPLMYGCGGGDYAAAWAYLNGTVFGQTEEWAYPYSNFFFNYTNPNATTDACKNVTDMFPNKNRPYSWFAELNRAGTTGYGSVTVNDAVSAMHALATIGPLSISVAAGNWQDYEAGVMQNTNATGGDNEWGIDHAVQMVGYGRDRDQHMDYWIVRNSWSTLWGEDGYIRLYRASNPDNEPCSPAEYGPVCGTSGCLSDPQWPFVRKNPGQKF